MGNLLEIAFFVPGVPVAQGSKKAIMGKHQRFPSVVDDNAAKLKPWRQLVTATAERNIPPGYDLIDQAWDVDLRFSFPRPKGHYRTGRNAHLLRDQSPVEMICFPDIDKLCRAVFDSLSGVVWVDDRHVVSVRLVKQYERKGSPMGVYVRAKPVRATTDRELFNREPNNQPKYPF